MKIAFIGQKGIPATQGGVEKHVEELATRLVRRGNEVYVYARNNYIEKNLGDFKGVKLIHLPSISSKHLDAISHTFLATMHAVFQNYDVVHYQGIGPSLLIWIFKLMRPGTPLIATFHCQDYYHQKWGSFARWILRLGEYMACKIPDKTVVISKILAAYVEKKYGRMATVISNGSEVFPTSEKERLSKWGLKEKKYILSVSRLVHHKGLHHLIKAFRNLQETNRIPNGFKLVIVGDGFHTDDYVKELKTLTGQSEDIIFTGRQSGESLRQLFSHAYLFVQPSESEGLSLALLEAMGYGLAPLVSDIPENSEPLGEIGYTFKNKNVVNLRDKLAYLLTDFEVVRETGILAKEKVEKEYGWEAIAEKTLEEYNLLIGKKNHAWILAKK